MSDRAGVFVQWKGTDVCLDFTCACGVGGHYDGDFAYVLRCAACGRKWEMPHTFSLVETDADHGAVQDTDFGHNQGRTINGADVVDVPADEDDDS